MWHIALGYIDDNNIEVYILLCCYHLNILPYYHYLNAYMYLYDYNIAVYLDDNNVAVYAVYLVDN